MSKLYLKLLEMSPTLTAVDQAFTAKTAREFLQHQSLKGYNKYNHTVDSAQVPEGYLDWVRHPLEELVDLCVYLQKFRSLDEYKTLDDRYKNWVVQIHQFAMIGANAWATLFDLERERFPDYTLLPSVLPSETNIYLVRLDLEDLISQYGIGLHERNRLRELSKRCYRDPAVPAQIVDECLGLGNGSVTQLQVLQSGIPHSEKENAFALSLEVFGLEG